MSILVICSLVRKTPGLYAPESFLNRGVTTTKMDLGQLYKYGYLILLLAPPVFSSAQSVDISFSKIPGPGDRPLGIISITQDRQGFLWFADQRNNNLKRYDGHTMKDYALGDISPDKGNVEAIAVDSGGMIWAGTWGYGLFRVDPITGSMTHYLHNYENPSSLSNNTISCLLVDHSGTLWIGSDGGLDLFDPETQSFTNYSHVPSDPTSLSHDKIRVLYQDRSGVIWAGTGFPWDLDSEGGLNRFDRKSGRFTRYLHDPDDPETLINNKVSALLEDSQGTFWVGTMGDGLHTLDRESGKFTRYTYDPKNPQNVSTSPSFYPAGHVRFITEDVQNNIWIGNSHNGINRYDLRTGNLLHFMNDNEVVAKPPHFPAGHKNNISEPGITNPWCMYSSADGTLFLADQNYSNQGLFRINLFDNILPAEPMGIHSFYEENEFVHWFGTQNGLIRKDLRNATTTEFVHHPNDSSSILHNTINSIIGDNEGNFWIGALENLECYEPGKNVFKHFPSGGQGSNSLQINGGINTLFLDNAGFLWVGTTTGLDRLNRNTGTVDHYLGYYTDYTDLSTTEINSIENIEDSNVLIATKSGLLKLNPENKEIDIFLADIIVNDIYKADEDLFWAATNDGLYRFEPGSGSLKNFGINTKAYAITADKLGNLWAGTSLGIMNLDKDGKVLSVYSEARGVQTKEPLNIAQRLADGRILIGGTAGHYIFDPEKLIEQPYSNKLFLTEFSIVGQEKHHNDLLLKDFYNSNPNQIKLSYDENTFSLILSELDLYDSGDEIYFQLENYDNDWRQVLSGETITYIKVAPGDYLLRANARNSTDARLAELRIPVIIFPPWWKTWWAYLLYVCLFFSLAYFIYLQVIKRERIMAKMKLDQLELEKAREMDQLKTRFFANVSHEFRTPLTLILGPLKQIYEGNFRGDLRTTTGVMIRNSKRLLRLINQLLDFSKLESGAAKLEVSVNDIVEFLRSMFAAFESTARDRTIRYIFQSEVSTLPTYFDHEKLEKIVINLLGNAFKFTPDGGNIRLEVRKVENNSSVDFGEGLVEVRIVDDGPGIPEDKLSHIFDRFYQVDSSSTRTSEGTGIGLSLAKELIELHHGSISAFNNGKQGTTLMFQLPLGKSHLLPDDIINGKGYQIRDIIDPETMPTAPDIVDQKTFVVQHDFPQVLVIDDNPDMRLYLYEILNESYQVIAVGNGGEGLDCAFDNIPDLVICDVMMPKIDGYQVCSRLKKDERTSHIPVILLTARAGEESRVEGLETGADDYITKPFSPIELSARVQNLIELRQKLREKFEKNFSLIPNEIQVTSVDKLFLQRAYDILEIHRSDPEFNSDVYAQEVGMSRSQLHRKFKALTNYSTGEFIRLYRLNYSQELMRKNFGDIAQVAYECGFSSPSYFTECFKKRFGIVPSEFVKVNSAEL